MFSFKRFETKNFIVIVESLLHVVTVDWCPDPPSGEGTTVAVTGKRTGSTATYACKPGFILFGQQVLKQGNKF